LNKYTQNQFKAAIKLKGISISEISETIGISMRMLEYYMKGEKNIRKADAFLELLEPELSQITGQSYTDIAREARRSMR